MSSKDWISSRGSQPESFSQSSQNGQPVSRRGWFVYCNGRRDLPAFDGKLEFTIKLIPYDGDDGWVDGTLMRIRELLMAPEAPPLNPECEYCMFSAKAAGQ